MVKRKGRMVIARVRKARTSKQKTITIPKSARFIRKGDYVQIRKVRRY